MGKKILHVVNISFVIPYYLGEQIDYFNSKGHTIIIACSPSEDFFDYSNKKSFTPFPLDIKRSFSIIKDLVAIFKLTMYLKNNPIDTVVGHTPKGAFIALISSWLTGVPNRIYFRHGLLFETTSGLKRNFLKFIEKITSQMATKIICVSPSVLEVSIQQKLSPQSKTVILNNGTCNGIDAIKRFNPENVLKDRGILKGLKEVLDSDVKIIGFVGRLVKDKGLVELLDAWKILSERNNKIHLLLIGPKEERDSLPEEYISYARDCKSIIMLGLIKEIESYYSLMDIFVLPSYREGFPTVVLEASAMELPVICSSKTGCIDSIIENETGLFASITPEDIAQKIQHLLNHPNKAKEMGKKGRLNVLKNFQQKLIWESMEKIY
ncbi:glycosyltransferase family 4 protein [Flavobacteriaceae bacterium]|nr:glycosyltransferase family 4 protein [Flavobacteriaceae bacterium]